MILQTATGELWVRGGGKSPGKNYLCFMRRRELISHIQKELSEVYPAEEARAIGYILLERVLGLHRETVALEPDAEVLLPLTFTDALEQLRRYRPLQYVLGETEFGGMRLRVDESVLIPRPETEELVRWIGSEWREKSPAVLDIGTGSGAIAVALAKQLPGAVVTAVDVSPEALDVAAGNARTNGARIAFLQMDILQETPPGKFDIIVSNPPYVRDSERVHMRRNVLDYEPATALFVPDDDPLLFYRRIVELGTLLLKGGGSLYFEINETFGKEAAELLSEGGYTEVEIRRDIFEKDRMIRGRRP